MVDEKAQLIEALAGLNRAVLAKLQGVGEYDLRRPLTPTGTNLLGVVKHLAAVQAGYLGDVFGRPWPEPVPSMGPDAELNDDLVATVEETSDEILDRYKRSWRHAEATVEATALDDTGTVPWWPEERRHPTLRTVLLHLTVETARHAGHLDIVRELIDGTAGRHPGDLSLPGNDEIDWAAFTAKVEARARAAAEPGDSDRSV
ncbi:MAG: DinB family protein [Actinomycetota bacterium]